MSEPGDNTAIGWHPSPDVNPLRDRIAAVLRDGIEQRATFFQEWDGTHIDAEIEDLNPGNLADAVIAELNLQPEVSWNDTYPVHRKLRYVTEWKDNDD